MSTSSADLTKQAIDILSEILEDTDVIERMYYLRSLLEISYAQHLTNLIKDLASNDCFGCQVDHPSQTQHDICIMMDFSQQVEKYLEPALLLLDENSVIGTWFGYLGKVQPVVRYHEISPYLDTDWRWDTWIDDDWKLDMTMMLLELDEDPHCFDYKLPA